MRLYGIADFDRRFIDIVGANMNIIDFVSHGIPWLGIRMNPLYRFE